ncbi:hypothetical protein LO80_09670 [Candidatus Francisella endociliophora]|uniref:PpiC domain-containing protein n=1 Tax=Candidatus Francisella endociliophora TaxID=653937 RepID=A0A097ERP2_9GAMM|nr:SurA N-terminal domain-containing protein [Francisella sp. FSC1006]AIT10212.1 hypothetical protein LO80_09670 [Francisella sp. FSC1006]
MLQSFNDRLKGPFTWTVVISISFIFVISGMSFFFTNMGGSKSYIAKVGDNEISSQQFEQYSQQAKTKEQKRQVLDQMINQYLVLADSQRHGIVLSKFVLQSAIFTNHMFFGEDGKFSTEKLKQVAQYVGGMGRLEQMMSQNLQGTIIPKNITDTEFTTDYENKSLASIYAVNKEIEYTKISPSALETEVNPSQKDLQDYYNAHKVEYMTPAQKTISYYEISKDDFITNDSINDQQVKDYYNSHKDLFKKLDEKTKTTIKKIIQNRQALEQFNKFAQGVDSASFNKLENKLGKPKTIDIINNSDSAVKGVSNSMFFASADKYASIPQSENKLLVYQVDKSQKATQQKFAEVKDKVSQAYIKEKSQKLALEKAGKLVSDLNSDKKVDASLDSATISNDSKDFSKSFNDYVMFNGNDKYYNYQTKDGDIYVYKVTKVEPNKDKKDEVPSQVLNAYKQEELNFYVQTIKKDIPVKVNYKNI